MKHEVNLSLSGNLRLRAETRLFASRHQHRAELTAASLQLDSLSPTIVIRRGSWSDGINAKDPAAFLVRGRCTPMRIGKECRVEMRLERAS